MSYYREQLESWLKKIEVSGRVIDVGGASNPVKDRVAKWDASEYVIADLSIETPMVKDFIKLDLNDRIPENFGVFDRVFCLEVFEYIWNPVMAMHNIKTMLAPQGVAYISFPTIYPPHNPEDIDYLRYTMDGVKKLLEVVEFKNYLITPRAATKGHDSLRSFYSQEGMHPRKNDPTLYNIGYMVQAFK